MRKLARYDHNSTISPEKLAEVTLKVPLDRDLNAVVDLLKTETAGDPRSEVLVTVALNGDATVTVRAWAASAPGAERLAGDLRLRPHATSC